MSRKSKRKKWRRHMSDVRDENELTMIHEWHKDVGPGTLEDPEVLAQRRPLSIAFKRATRCGSSGLGRNTSRKTSRKQRKRNQKPCSTSTHVLRCC